MFATGETVGLAKWIIDDTCLVVVVVVVFGYWIVDCAVQMNGECIF